ncbi:hypothetical protein THASP1DRAFT_28493 [Thamnocephalis sphaerospora]|uniref:F-box domain-containing protein n=1 Tax=Thamnocephalis sphaerospora TaxID=78915 RepID=A0A4P9XU43_9FUNG|nr:hypothetical protein THASP1DRAFT_28493 [Thamnocephalis sphaerospora]|eukprot:RKP09723.1 hypothetical protein THASP1DRAFT_28493 [Thamnocephalis sphaerospora]
MPTAPHLPRELWLLVALYADAFATLRLYMTSRAFCHMLVNAQNLWQRLYYAAFSNSAAERFWIDAYRARLAGSAGLDAGRVRINWRCAILARRQTEINWRLGHSVRRSCSVPKSLHSDKDWLPRGFTPYELLLSNCRMPYTVSATAVDATHVPSLVLLDDASTEEQAEAYVYDTNEHCLLLCTWALQPGSPLWARQLTGGPVRKLTHRAYIADKRGRWVIACQDVSNLAGREAPAHWLLLDADGEYRPYRLKALDAFDFGEYAVDPALDADQEDIEKESVFSLSYRDVCIVAAHQSRVTLCAINGSRNRLYWKVIEVTFGHDAATHDSGNGARSKEGAAFVHVRALHSGYFLDACIHGTAAYDLFAGMLDDDYICVRGHYYCNSYIFVLATKGFSSNVIRPLKAEPNARAGLRTFQHGWIDRATQIQQMCLAHRQLLVTVSVDLGSPDMCDWPIRLLRFSDGHMAASYTLPYNSSINHILGDLVLVVSHHDGNYSTRLVDIYTGNAVRTVHTVASCAYTSPNIVSPLYLFSNSSASAESSDYNACDAVPQDKCESPSVQCIRWLDFMPDVDLNKCNSDA